MEIKTATEIAKEANSKARDSVWVGQKFISVYELEYQRCILQRLENIEVLLSDANEMQKLKR